LLRGAEKWFGHFLKRICASLGPFISSRPDISEDDILKQESISGYSCRAIPLWADVNLAEEYISIENSPEDLAEASGGERRWQTVLRYDQNGDEFVHLPEYLYISGHRASSQKSYRRSQYH